jgi:hypothetical protein
MQFSLKGKVTSIWDARLFININGKFKKFSVKSVWENDVTHFECDENDLLHAENGPALITKAGAKVWYKHGLCHREDGPAYIISDNVKSWYYEGQEIDVKCQEDYERYFKLKSFL